jgi:hypothetical protein
LRPIRFSLEIVARNNGMAWTETCKMDAVTQIDKRKVVSGSIRNALRELSKESGIPYGTLRRWYYPDSVINNGNILSKKSVEKETCVTHDYHTLTFDSGQKILFSIHLTNDDLYLVMQEFKVGRNGKETPTNNRFTISYNNISEVKSGFDKFSEVDYRKMYKKLNVGGPDTPKKDEVESPTGDDGDDTRDNDHDSMVIETESSPAPDDAPKATTSEAELFQCVDCVHFAVNKGAPEANGAYNSRSGSWNGNIFQPPHEPHPCPNFQGGDLE